MNKESKASKLGRMSKTFTKCFLIFAISYFAFRILASILFNV
jgi:hypothetical protein